MFSLKVVNISLVAILLSSVPSFANTDDIKLDPYLFNPASRVMTQDAWDKILDKSIEDKKTRINQERMFSKAKLITIDTRDQETCKKIESQLNEYRQANPEAYDICKINKKNPYATITIQDESYETRGIYYSELDKKSKKMVDNTKNLTILGAGVIGAIWMMPESVSNWDEEKVGKKIGDKYVEHITNAPVMDKDALVINLIGHPYSGAIYYSVARHAGLTKMQSFGYSVFMSTVFWEYGLEAIFEEPSIQDLFITPILGSLLGAAFEHYTEVIKNNEGKVWNSEFLGSVVMGIMNPTEVLMDNMNNMFKNDFIKDSRVYLYTKPKFFQDGRETEYQIKESFVGVGLELKF